MKNEKIARKTETPGEMKTIRVGFIGNPNCGKTTLFNAYTGANLKVANWPGVTSGRLHDFSGDADSAGGFAGHLQPDFLYDGREGFPRIYPQ